jgi:hypothetical protein
MKTKLILAAALIGVQASTAQVIDLGRGASPSVFAQRQRCQTFGAVPIASRPISEVRAGRTFVVVSGDHVQNPASRSTNQNAAIVPTP